MINNILKVFTNIMLYYRKIIFDKIDYIKLR
jgi:hypothetical protein